MKPNWFDSRQGHGPFAGLFLSLLLEAIGEHFGAGDVLTIEQVGRQSLAILGCIHLLLVDGFVVHLDVLLHLRLLQEPFAIVLLCWQADLERGKKKSKRESKGCERLTSLRARSESL